MAQAHAVLVNQIIDAINVGNREARAWVRVNGVFRPLHTEHPKVRVGIVGAADIYGVVGSRHFEIEAKVGKDPLRDGQTNWRDFCASFGIPYLICHADSPATIPQAAKTAAEWVKTLSEQANDGAPTGKRR